MLSVIGSGIMPLTRREFLTKLSTIAILAPILPKLLTDIAPVDSINELTATYIVPKLADEVFKSSPFSLKLLEEAYQSCCYGYQEPDLMVMAPDVYARFVELEYEMKERLGRLTYVNHDFCHKFNNAYVTYSKGMPGGSWLAINSAHPKGKGEEIKYSGMFYKGDPKWHPIPKEI